MCTGSGTKQVAFFWGGCSLPHILHSQRAPTHHPPTLQWQFVRGLFTGELLYLYFGWTFLDSAAGDCGVAATSEAEGAVSGGDGLAASCEGRGEENAGSGLRRRTTKRDEQKN